ncbi:MAG: hypothetical protein KN64_07505 [Sulfurovum sp. AS07-7]|jgi:hypothetical protein|nr:MAG: hypothetical protein KN64_07505 [Sulfurovum sp. AS07-7]
MEEMVSIKAKDFRVLYSALTYVLYGPEAIEEIEFHTLIGIERKDADKLSDELEDLYKKYAPKTIANGL